MPYLSWKFAPGQYESQYFGNHDSGPTVRVEFPKSIDRETRFENGIDIQPWLFQTHRPKDLQNTKA